MKRVLLWGLALYLGAVVVLGFALGSLNLPRFGRLASDGVQAQATVTTTDCRNHGVVRYKFEVNGQEVTGAGQPGWGNPPCEQLHAGDRLAVWYLPADPAVNLPGEPGPRLTNELVFVGVTAVGMPALVALAAVLKAWWLRPRGSSIRPPTGE